MKKSMLSIIGFYAMVAIVIVVALFPFYYMILMSFKSGTDLFVVNYLPKFSSDLFVNYKAVFKNYNFGMNLINSTIVAFSVTFLSLCLSLTAAYALGRVNFRGRGLLLMVILSVSMFPQVAVLTGMFQMIRFFELYNTLTGLVLTYMMFTLPFTVWVLNTFMREIPVELEESAIIDGLTPLGIVFRIFLPLLLPALATTGILAFIAAWNEFLFALTFTADDTARTVPVAISLISGTSQYEVPFGLITAASVIVTLPLIIVVMIFQRKIISGLTGGAVKG